jgi:protein-S-isoprenylcysteine O-methyltransferase Ste14
LKSWLENARGEWYVAIQVVLFAGILLGPKEWPGVLGRLEGPAAWVSAAVGLVLGGLGAALAGWGLLGLGRNLTALPKPLDDSQLVTGGPYALVRHPIYSGLIIGAFGWALLWASPLALIYALVLLAFFDLKSRREEVWLRERYADYASYSSRVRKLIPFVY